MTSSWGVVVSSDCVDISSSVIPGLSDVTSVESSRVVIISSSTVSSVESSGFEEISGVVSRKGVGSEKKFMVMLNHF